MANSILESLLAPYRLAVEGRDPDYENDPLYAALAPSVERPRGGGGGPAPQGLDAIQRKLYKGFMDAGRPDLAKMVGTDAFDTWIGQESGYRPGAVSPANNQGQRNGGLFQFWYGHDFSDPFEGANRFSMPVRQQARAAATHFNLTPERIREFARQIQSGNYPGWG